MATLKVPAALILTMGQLLGSFASDAMPCPVCGDDLGVHEWIKVETDPAKVVTCDRA